MLPYLRRLSNSCQINFPYSVIHGTFVLVPHPAPYHRFFPLPCWDVSRLDSLLIGASEADRRLRGSCEEMGYRHGCEIFLVIWGMIIEPHNITNDEVERESESLKETFWCQSAVRLSRSSHQVWILWL